MAHLVCGCVCVRVLSSPRVRGAESSLSLSLSLSLPPPPSLSLSLSLISPHPSLSHLSQSLVPPPPPPPPTNTHTLFLQSPILTPSFVNVSLQSVREGSQTEIQLYKKQFQRQRTKDLADFRDQLSRKDQQLEESRGQVEKVSLCVYLDPFWNETPIQLGFICPICSKIAI